MFKIIPFTPTVPKYAILTEPIRDEFKLLTCALDNFDREGYEYLPIEKDYYEVNGYQLFTKKVFAKESGNSDQWNSLIYPWVMHSEPIKDIYIDHSYCLQAFRYAGKAKKQIQKMAQKRPELMKLLASKIKYGVDFCIDYITKDGCFEILHFEWDYLEYEYTQFIDDLKFFEDRINTINWYEFIDILKSPKSPINGMDDESVADWKAQMFGLSSAFRLRKRI